MHTNVCAIPTRTTFSARLCFSTTNVSSSPKRTNPKHHRNSSAYTNGITQITYAFCRSPCVWLWCGFALALEGHWDTILDCKCWLWHSGQWRTMGDLCCHRLHRLQSWIASCVSDIRWTKSLSPSFLSCFIDQVQNSTLVQTPTCVPYLDQHACKLPLWTPFVPCQIQQQTLAAPKVGKSAHRATAIVKQFKVTRWTAVVLLLPWQFEWKYLRGLSQAWNFHKVHFQASIEYTDGVEKQRGCLVTFIVVVKAAAEGKLKELAQGLLLQHSKGKELGGEGGERPLRRSSALEDLPTCRPSRTGACWWTWWLQPAKWLIRVTK